jgi:hypothetical protein
MICMPLRDHFRPPLSEVRHWESFHSRWATVIADTLDADLLPPGYFAEVQLQLGNQVEVDIAAFEDQTASQASTHAGNTATAVAVAPAAVWSPPAVDMVLPAVFPDRIEVLVFRSEGGPTLVAAIELISPRNKDRPQRRRAFATKCAAYLQQGIGVVVVDVVTSRHANLHNELIRVLDLDEAQHGLDAKLLYAVAYRPIQVESDQRIDVWHRALCIGRPLPMLPLPLDKGQCLRLDIESIYMEACERTRLPIEP